MAFGVQVTGPANEKEFIDAIARALRLSGGIDAKNYVIDPQVRIDKSVVGIMVALRQLPVQ